MRCSLFRPSPCSVRARAPKPGRYVTTGSYFGKDGLAGQLGGHGDLENLLKGQQPLDLGGGATGVPTSPPGEDDPLNYDPEGAESSPYTTTSMYPHCLVSLNARLSVCGACGRAPKLACSRTACMRCWVYQCATCSLIKLYTVYCKM